MSEPRLVTKHTSAFFGTAVIFLVITISWNILNVCLLDISVHDRWVIGMGIVSAMFAVVVISKVVRDREEANALVNEVRQAKYEQVLAHAPVPGFGQL